MGVQHVPMIAPTMPGMRSIELFAAVLAAVLGWAGIGILLLGPTTAAASLSLDPGGVSSSSAAGSLLQAGVPPLLAFQLLCVAVAFGGSVVGAWLHARGDRQAGRIVAGAALVPVVVAVLNLAAGPYLLPGAAVAVLAAAVALAPVARRAA